MSTFKIKSFLFSFAVLMLLPQTSSAFDIKNQSAVWLDDTTFLYTITYEFGFLNRDFKMPIGVSRTSHDSVVSDLVDYSLVKDGKEITSGFTSYSIVLSGASVSGGKYYVPRSEKEDFTLVVVGRLLAGTTRQDFDGTAMKVNKLPYRLIDGEKETANTLHEEELQKYITPAIVAR